MNTDNALLTWRCQLVCALAVMASGCADGTVSQNTQAGVDAGVDVSEHDAHSDASEHDSDAHADSDIYADTDAEADADTDTDAEPTSCASWCTRMRECDLMGVAQDMCEESCEAALETAFTDTCTECLGAATCGDAWDTCFAPGQACYREPTTSYLVSIEGFGDDVEGATGVGRITTYSGQPLGAFDDAEVSENRFALNFGTVLSPGLEYRVQYWIDRDADGVCTPETDDAYEYSLLIDESIAVLYETLDVEPEQRRPEVCEAFDSVDSICQSQCARRQACGAPADELAECQQNCVEEPSPVKQIHCLSCLEDFACGEHVDVCDQVGGVCNSEYVEPSTEYLISGSNFVDEEAKTVSVQIEDLAGQPVTPLLSDTVEDGSFFIHFGKVLWPNRSYTAVYFFDLNDNGQCDPSDRGWTEELVIEDSSLRYDTVEPDPEREFSDVCAHIQLN